MVIVVVIVVVIVCFCYVLTISIAMPGVVSDQIGLVPPEVRVDVGGCSSRTWVAVMDSLPGNEGYLVIHLLTLL